MTPFFLTFCLVGIASACTFQAGDDVQHGYCTFYTSQSFWYNPYNSGCFMDCKCKISSSGVSYTPIRGCLESYPCFTTNGNLRNFSLEYVKENVIGNCYVYNDNDQCTLSCACKEGYVDYMGVKCGTCSGCQCQVNLTSGKTEQCSNNYICLDNYLDQINVNNTVSCTTTGPNCALQCNCRPGYSASEGIQCNRCNDCTCPLNLTTSVADCGCNKTFAGMYMQENVNKCWIGLNSDQCFLHCECKPNHVSDGDKLCGKAVRDTSLSKGAIVGIVVGAITGAVIVISVSLMLCSKWMTGFWCSC